MRMDKSFRPIDTNNPPPNVRHGHERANSGCYAHVLAGTVLQDEVILGSDVALLVN
jgi:hypothetical protein